MVVFSIMRFVSETVKDVGHHVLERAQRGRRGQGAVSGTLLLEVSSITKGQKMYDSFDHHVMAATRMQRCANQLPLGARTRLGGGRGSVKRQCCVRHGDSDVLSYNIGLGFIMFNRARAEAAGFFPHATSRTPAQKRPPRRPLKPASVLL